MRLLPLLALLAACTSKGDDSTAVVDTDTDTTDTGPTEPTPVWDDRHIETSSTLNGIYASGAGVYVGGTGGVVLQSEEDGSWTDISPAVEESDIGDLWGQGNGASLVLVAGAGSGYVARWEGGSWGVVDVGTAATEGVDGSSADTLFAVTWGGIYVWDGSTWSFETADGNPKLNDVYAIGGDAVAVGEAGSVVRRSGGSWSTMPSGTTVDLAGVSGSSLDDVWAVGAEGVAIHWDGTAWNPTDTGTTDALWAVWAASPSSVFAVGNGGTAIHWDGSAWTSLPTGVDNNLYSLHGTDASSVFAGGNRGAFLHYAG